MIPSAAVLKTSDAPPRKKRAKTTAAKKRKVEFNFEGNAGDIFVARNGLQFHILPESNNIACDEESKFPVSSGSTGAAYLPTGFSVEEKRLEEHIRMINRKLKEKQQSVDA